VITAPPSRARVVVVGGGVVGCSTAYHLARRGWTDVVLLERKRLTSGTTWHAAGLITQARPTYGTREIVRRSLKVFKSLPEETGLATGFSETGTLHLADSAERLEELRRQASAAKANGITAEVISPERAGELFPLLYPADLAGAVYYPDDGRGNATDTTMALAAGARQHGVRIFESTPVTGVIRRDGRVAGVRTAGGDIEAEYVVAATGIGDASSGRWPGSPSRSRRSPTTTSSPRPSPAWPRACRRSRPRRTTPT
jgi:glycine/D-amino acid oxidase-like deaminating enzyme